MMKEQNLNLLYEKPRPRSETSFEPGLFSKHPRVQATVPLPNPLNRIELRSEPGENAFPKNVLKGFGTNLDQGGLALFPPEAQHQIVALATKTPESFNRPISAWSITELTDEVLKQHYVTSIGRSTVWRLLDQAALKPHKFRYWCQSPDPDFEAKMFHILDLYLHPSENAVLLCFDEKTAIHALERKQLDIPMGPGKPCRITQRTKLHGIKNLLAAFEVSSGKVFGQLHEGHASGDCVLFLESLAYQYTPEQTLHIILDNYATHSTPKICKLIAELCKVSLPELLTQAQRRQWLEQNNKRIVFHFLPTRASWLNQIEIWFSAFSKRCLKHLNVSSMEDFIQKVALFIQYYNLEFAHPYAWTYTGKPLAIGNLVKNL
jgi:transposase